MTNGLSCLPPKEGIIKDVMSGSAPPMKTFREIDNGLDRHSAVADSDVVVEPNIQCWFADGFPYDEHQRVVGIKATLLKVLLVGFSGYHGSRNNFHHVSAHL